MWTCPSHSYLSGSSSSLLRCHSVCTWPAVCCMSAPQARLHRNRGHSDGASQILRLLSGLVPETESRASALSYKLSPVLFFILRQGLAKLPSTGLVLMILLPQSPRPNFLGTELGPSHFSPHKPPPSILRRLLLCGRDLGQVLRSKAFLEIPLVSLEDSFSSPLDRCPSSPEKSSYLCKVTQELHCTQPSSLCPSWLQVNTQLQRHLA